MIKTKLSDNQYFVPIVLNNEKLKENEYIDVYIQLVKKTSNCSIFGNVMKVTKEKLLTVGEVEKLLKGNNENEKKLY